MYMPVPNAYCCAGKSALVLLTHEYAVMGSTKVD